MQDAKNVYILQISTQYHAKIDTTKHAEDAVVYVRTLLSGVDGYCQ